MTSSAAPPRLLVVDDNAANIRLLEAILSNHGYAVATASDGAAALTAVAVNPPDLVLLDIQMPGIDGYEVCKRLRADAATAALPIIMITAAGPAEKVAALEAGADDFLPRPLEQAELLARVRSLLRMKHYSDQVAGQAAELAAWNRVLEEQVRERVEEVERMKGLRRFLSTRVAELVLTADGGSELLQPHRREVGILFCDLRGFTAFSVNAEPEDVVGALKHFHAVTGSLIGAHGGTVGPFTGDGLVVIFNDPVACPEPALRAVTMAVELREAIGAFEEEWSRRGHTLSAGIGVTYGFATMGVMGFEDRSDYMAVGPVVNLASRLCDRAAAGEILVSQRVVTETSDAVEFAERGPMELRGFPAAQPVYAVQRLLRRTSSGPRVTPELQVDVLGPLQITCGGEACEISAARERALFLLLLLHRRRVVPVDVIVRELPPQRTADATVSAVRVLVSRLRKTLAAARLEHVLVTKPSGYLLDVADSSLDMSRFDGLVASARAAVEQGDAPAAAALLREGLALWRGEAFADLAGSTSAAAEVARLEESRLSAVEDCMTAEIEAGRHRIVLGELEALVAEHPLRERLWATLMLALHRSGRQPDALAAYHKLRQQLADELGLDPSPELARLHDAILRRDASLQPTCQRLTVQ